MSKMSSKISSFQAGLLASVAALALFSAPLRAEEAAAALDASRVVAVVNGTEITLGHMIALRESLPQQYLTLPDDVLFSGVLDQLIQQTALSAEREGKLSKRDELMIEVDRRAYLSGVILNAVAQSAVSEEAVQAAYDAKYKSVEPSREFHAAHILVDTEEKAKALKAEIDGGLDFAEAARKNSSDGSAASGGDLGWFPLSAMVEPFGKAVAELEPNEVSAPVQTQFGWHVIKFFESRLAEAPKIEDIREELEGEIRAQAVEAHVAKLVEEAGVEKKVEGIDPAILKKTELLGE